MTHSCTVCGSQQTTAYIDTIQSVYTDTAYQLRRCSDCTHIFTSPQPSPATLDDIYTNHYAYDVHLIIEAEKRYRARQTADYITKHTTAQSVCEPGCMYGFLLSELQQRQVVVTGIEIDQTAAQYCTDHGLRVLQSSLEDYTAGEPEQFDLVVLSHALEHIVDPHQQLQQIQRLLPDQGQVLIIVPSTDSWTQKVSKKYWGYWQVPVHINHFNARSLTTLLDRNGYSVVDVQYRGGDSLLGLSFIANLLGVRAGNGSVSGPVKALIQLYSAIAKYWYNVGNDDLLVLARKR